MIFCLFFYSTCLSIHFRMSGKGMLEFPAVALRTKGLKHTVLHDADGIGQRVFHQRIQTPCVEHHL